MREIPRQWDFGKNGMVPTGPAGLLLTVVVDGHEVRSVRRYDMDEGTCTVLCRSGHTGSFGRTHISEDDPEEVCEIVLSGEIEAGWKT